MTLGHFDNSNAARSFQATQRKLALLAEVRSGQRLCDACETTQIPGRTAQRWRETDPVFKAELDKARQSTPKLTQRDRDVMRLVALGYTNQQIADTLHFGLSTVHHLMTDIMRKRNVSSRAQLAVEAVRVGAIVVEVTA